MPRQPEPRWFDGFMESSWGGVVSAVVDQLEQAPQKHVVDQMMQFVGNLHRNILPWFVRVIPDPCAISRCRQQAVLYCESCKQPVCLAHIHLSHRGTGICDQCVADLCGVQPEPEPRRRQQQTGGIPAEKIRWARRQLGVRPGATMREIQRQFRKLSAEHHPDRAQTEAQRQRREDKMKRISEAYHLLQRLYEREAA